MRKPSISSAAIWSVLDVSLGQGLTFAISVVLARLLTPDEFGTIALLALFIAVAGLFVEGGLGQALIQRQDLTEEDCSTVFWFNITVAVVVAGLLAAAAPTIAVFFDKPVVAPLTMVMAANIVVGAFGMVHRTLFAKRLAFRPLMIAGAVSTVLSGATVVACASAGYGVWSLAAQSVVAGLVSTLMLWVLSPWRPHLVFSFASVRRLFGFGGYVLAAGLLEVIYSRAHTVLIGKFYGTADLGQFARAEATQVLPTTLVTNSFARVALPALSPLAKDKHRMVGAMRYALQIMMLLKAPIMFGLAVLAEPFIVTLYGPAWLPAVPLLQVLCLAALLMPLHMLNVQALLAIGRSNIVFKLEIAKKAVGLTILVAAASFGPFGIACGIVLTSLLSVAINTSQSQKLLGYGMLSQLADSAPATALAATMAGGLWWVLHVTQDLPEPARLALSISIGAAYFSFVATVLRLPGVDALLSMMLRRPYNSSTSA